MGAFSIANMTPEQRKEALALAAHAKAEKTRIWKENAWKLRQTFADAPHWRKLASRFGVRMPSEWVPGDEYRPIRKAIRKLGISPEQVRDTFGGDVKFIHGKNPTWPAWAIIGLMLEIAEQNAA